MKAIHITAAGGPEVLELRHVDIPEVASDEVLVKVHYAGINRHDIGQRRRGPSSVHSDVPGLEVAGIIATVGDRVGGWSVGDRVCALTDGGGYAEYAVANAGHLLRLGAGQSMKEAAALPEALFTAWHNFFNVAQLGPGESVLIHGGTSGVGTIAIQLLKRLGHPVFATCGSPEKVVMAQLLGARRAFNYRTDDFAESILQETSRRGVDVILDMAGGEHMLANLKALAKRGRLVHLQPGRVNAPTVPLYDLMVKEIKLTGSVLRPLPADEKSSICRRLMDVAWPLVLAGDIQPSIAKAFGLGDAAHAHALLESANVAGKLVLKVGENDDDRQLA